MSVSVALQLWSIHDETAKDFVKALEAVAKMGYDGVEFAGYGELSAAEMKGHLDRLGLKASSAHVPLDRLREDLDGQIAYNKAIGSQYIFCPYSKGETEEDYIAISEELAAYGEKIRAAGLGFGYHNHAHEFTEYGGKYAMDILLGTSDEMLCELDTYWSEFAGIDTLAYLNKMGSRCKVLHLKDMRIQPDGSKKSCTYGEGILDRSAIVSACLKNNPDWLVIEWEDFGKPSLEAVDNSLKNLRSLLANL